MGGKIPNALFCLLTILFAGRNYKLESGLNTVSSEVTTAHNKLE